MEKFINAVFMARANYRSGSASVIALAFAIAIVLGVVSCSHLPCRLLGRNVHSYAAGAKRDDACLRSALGNDIGITMTRILCFMGRNLLTEDCHSPMMVFNLSRSHEGVFITLPVRGFVDTRTTSPWFINSFREL